MAGNEAMTALHLRKQTLLLESDLNRLTLQAECAHLREAGGWLGRIKETRHQLTPWLWVLAPLAGLGLALGLRRSSSGASFWARALAVAPSLIQLWRACTTPSRESK